MLSDESTTDAGSTDTGSTDSGATDTGATDTGATDSGSTDTASTDTGSTDTGSTDSGATDTGSTDSGATDTGATDTGATDTGSTDAGNTENVDIASSIIGSWYSECEVLANGALSARQTFVFNDTQLIRDWYEFDGDTCSGVPRGKTFPLSVDNYELGAQIFTTDGKTAREINLTIVQLPETTYSPGFGSVVQTGLEVGEQRFTVVSYENGKVLWQDREPTNADNRFTNFDNGLELVPRVSLSKSDITAQDIRGFYRSACRTTDNGYYAYNVSVIDTDNVERYQEHFFYNYLCLGEAPAITEIPYANEFGTAFTNDFGDTLLSTIRTRQQQTILKGAELLDFELLPARDSRYSAYALLGDTLLSGDCVIRVEDCKNTSEYPADHIDFEFNASIRNVRTDSASAAPGVSDTSAIAGFWDGTNTNDNGDQDVYYILTSDNGLATYYDYLGDTVDNGDDCYFIYTENITYFGDDSYLYDGLYSDGSPYEYAEISSIVNSMYSFVGSSGVRFSLPPATVNLSDLNECV